MNHSPAPPRSNERSALLAELVDQLTARVQAGHHLDMDAVAAEFPEFAHDLRQLLPAIGLLGELSRSREPLGSNLNGSGDLAGTLGDYRIIREIGRGGMGVVYEAEQISLPRRVALKVLPFAAVMDPRQLQRFKNEARAAASLDHPNVVKVYGVGCERGVHFIALQFIDGRTLADLIRKRRGIPAPTLAPAGGQDVTRTYAADGTTAVHVVAAAEGDDTPAGKASSNRTRTPVDAVYIQRVVEWGIQAAEALEHAHTLGIVHRDVKPGNLLIDGRGEVYVADFGLAKLAADPGVTGTGDMLGTLRYMSPEQAGAKHDLVDHRSDVYSLGVTLYELLTLTPAFNGVDRQQILTQISTTDPIAPRKLDRHIPRDLETVILKAMDKEPARRYQSAKEFADDLRRCQEHEPVLAKPSTFSHRLRTWSRRNPAIVRSSMIILLLLTVGSSLSTWLVWQEKSRTTLALAAETAERTRADEEKRIAQERDAETAAVLGFVESTIFAAARPEGKGGGLGREVKLRQALEAALPLVATKFTHQPLTEARLRRTIGLSFRYLGDETTAAAQFEAASKLYATHLRPDDPLTLTVNNNLANSYAALGRNDEGLKLREETLTIRRRVLSPDHPDTLESMANLATSYHALGRYEEALDLRERVLNLRTQKVASSEGEIREARNNLSISYATLGRHEKVVELREQMLSAAEAQYGLDHIDTLPFMNNLAQSLAALRRYEEAIKLFEKTLKLTREKYSPKYLATYLVMNNLAWVLATAEDVRFRNPTRAVELASTAAQGSPKRADYWGTLGTARYRAGDWKGSVLDLQKAIDLRGAKNLLNANESFFLAMAHWQLGDKIAARESFDRAVAWMNMSQARKDETSRFKDEAEKLLGTARGLDK